MKARAIIIAVVLVTASPSWVPSLSARELHARPLRRRRNTGRAGVVMSHDVPLYLQGVGTVIAYNPS